MEHATSNLIMNEETMDEKKRSNLKLGDVVQTLQDLAGSDEETVAVLAHLIRTRQVRRPAAAHQ